MYYIVIRGNWRPEKNVNHFLEWFDQYREEQRRWGVVSAKLFHAWFGGDRQFTCLYGVESIDRWNEGQHTPEGLEAIMAIGQVVDVKSLQFEVVKEVPVEF